MASSASPTFSCPISSRKHKDPKPRRVLVKASNSDEPSTAKRKPVEDTRIHWSSPDEGWIGGKSSSSQQSKTETQKEPPLGERFADIINQSSASHYQFLGVKAEADMEEIKAAYRRLSKEYHPDTTSLPLKAASEKFMQLREAYNVLSNEDRRKFYDWTLAQEAESRQAQRMRMRLEDRPVNGRPKIRIRSASEPKISEISDTDTDSDIITDIYRISDADTAYWRIRTSRTCATPGRFPIPDTVDRLGGKNMKLSDQAMTALTIDVVIIIFAICSIIYVSLFKESY